MSHPTTKKTQILAKNSLGQRNDVRRANHDKRINFTFKRIALNTAAEDNYNKLGLKENK